MNHELVRKILSDAGLGGSSLTDKELLAFEMMLEQKQIDFDVCFYRIEQGIRQMSAFRSQQKLKAMERAKHNAELEANISEVASTTSTTTGSAKSTSATSGAGDSKTSRPTNPVGHPQRRNVTLRGKSAGQ